MPVGHYQLFRFSLASEAVLPDNCIVSATPLPPCVLERVMGTVFAQRACPLVWTGLKQFKKLPDESRKPYLMMGAHNIILVLFANKRMRSLVQMF